MARDKTRLADRALKMEQPQHTVRLPEYYIGRYPVTNLQYAAFVQATGHGMPLWPGGRYPTGRANHPVDGLPWDFAQAYVA
ncbi:MAG: SUMF1/EgtB/PvdO family nonheme iron enzyme, partial [Anaerolineae bacterium]|nr:SUMF1/EgtB/PvdO family nonheme iron enzyme [Anaerolineae bacterium]